MLRDGQSSVSSVPSVFNFLSAISTAMSTREKSSCSTTRRFPVLVRKYSIHPHSLDPRRTLHRIIERGLIADLSRIEQHEIRVTPFLNAPAMLQPKSFGGQARHFTYGFRH